VSTLVRFRVLVTVIATALWLSADDGRLPTGVIHMTVRVPSPVALQVNSVLLPFSTATLCGGKVMSGGPTGVHREHNRHFNHHQLTTLPYLLSNG